MGQPKDDINDKALIQFYMNSQESIRYHGRRMWDSMKFFALTVPAFNSIIIFVLEYLVEDKSIVLPIRDWLPWLLLAPIALTIIFWLNSLREYNRFLEYALMSWRAERLLGLHETREELNGKAVVLDRFKKKPDEKPKFDICKPWRDWNFWVILCLFFGVSLVIQIVILCYFVNL